MSRGLRGGEAGSYLRERVNYDRPCPRLIRHVAHAAAWRTSILAPRPVFPCASVEVAAAAEEGGHVCRVVYVAAALLSRSQGPSRSALAASRGAACVSGVSTAGERYPACTSAAAVSLPTHAATTRYRCVVHPPRRGLSVCPSFPSRLTLAETGY